MEEPDILKVLPGEELSEEAIAAALEKDFKAKDGSSAEETFAKREKQAARRDKFIEKKLEAKEEAPKPRRVVKLSSLKNLRQWSDKTVSPEAKETSLANLNTKMEVPTMSQTLEEMKFPDSVRNPETIRNCLTKDEIIYFIDRWNQYYTEYGADLNSANDYDQMVELIMNLIDLYRIQKKKKTSEKLVVDPLVDQIVHRTHTRVQTLLASLKTRRKDRVEMNVHKEDNLVKLLLQKAKDGGFKQEVTSKMRSEEDEELEGLNAKRTRGNIHFEEKS